jgi:hypothetical protein
MATPVVVGIDNGLHGAVVALDARCRVMQCSDTPIIVEQVKRSKRGRYLTGEMVAIVDALSVAFDVRCVLVEKGQPMRNGVIATFMAGYCEAAWLTACQALCLPCMTVAASTWQTSQLRDVPGADTKTRSVIQAGRLLPELAIKEGRKTLDGRADAGLIARYGVVDLGLLGKSQALHVVATTKRLKVPQP